MTKQIARYVVLILLIPWFASKEIAAVQVPMTGMEMGKQAASDTHQDHNPKHGGTFFMAMDNFHHLEGTLEAPGIFRVYVYDDHTKPLTKVMMRQVSGTVQVGDSEDAPKVPLVLSKDGATLELPLAPGTRLPVTLTLFMRFPGMVKDARPELFTFPFAEYTKEKGRTSPKSVLSGAVKGY